MKTNSTATPIAISSYPITSKEVNPAGYKPHPLLKKFGVKYETNQALIAVYKKFSMLAEKPIVTKNKEVITHMDDVNAAIANNTNIKVYEVEIPDDEIPLLINLKYSRSKSSLSGEFEKIKFLEKLIKSPKGVELFKDVQGDTREKIASIMSTSHSTIKRIMFIGNNKPSEFGLIEQSEKSMKEVAHQITEEQRKKNKREPGVKRKTLEKKDVTGNSSLAFANGQFTIQGIGTFDLSVLNGKLMLKKDNIKLEGFSYQGNILDDKKFASVASFIFKSADPNTMDIQIIINNYNKI